MTKKNLTNSSRAVKSSILFEKVSPSLYKTSRERPKSAPYLRLKIEKGGTLCDFLTSIVLQNIETNEGGTLWCNPKSFKKSHSAEKKWGYVGFLSVFPRFWTSVLFFSFRFGRASEVGVVEV